MTPVMVMEKQETLSVHDLVTESALARRYI